MTNFDLSALHRLAGSLEPGSLGMAALTAMIAEVESDVAASRWYLNKEDCSIDAPPQASAVDSVTVHRGWHEIFGRTDAPSFEVVSIVAQWWPHALPIWHQVVVGGGSAEGVESEWARGLVRVDVPFAQFAILEGVPNEVAEYLVEPLSGAPVVRWLDGQLCAALPDRLPGGTPRLSEVVFSRRLAWLRLEHGTLHPAPGEAMYYGPGAARAPALAGLVERLMVDITSDASGGAWSSASAGLQAVMKTAWSDGTVMTRADLERARAEALRQPED